MQQDRVVLKLKINCHYQIKLSSRKLYFIKVESSFESLVESFIKKGGRINKHYLHSWNTHKASIVYLKGWYGGKTVREAILKALSKS